ncbi:alpha/beta hydrolase [Streptomyces sp. SID13726]|uniref:alpha/beta fold hydrolase n=1 Tax=Streptomyces sp. SID13726 TaxID=2706058 RepID=UPI0013BA5BA4|nr:alpha/beta hydrolase [Streptomyces sp. SID13726]
MRSLKATATAVTATLAAAAAAAAAAGIVAGRIASNAALKAPPGTPFPGDPDLTVHATTPGRITLTRDLAALRPGTYGLTGDDTHARVGPVLPTEPHSADTVVRRLDHVTGTLHPGDKVRLTPNVHVGDPSSALGLDHTDIDIVGELGPLPAWFVPGVRDTWVITVHGLGATREHALNVMEFLHHHRFPVLTPTYRGDEGAPRSPDGLHHFGETEWRDLDAAMRHAVQQGARQLVLLGWSTGATMALRATARSPLRDRVKGLVLDSPVLSWERTLRALAAARHTPGPLLPLAVRAAQGRTGLPSDNFGLYADRTPPYTETTPDHPTTPHPTTNHPAPTPPTPPTPPPSPHPPPPPTLIFHGPDDLVAPWTLSRHLAAAHPDRITLHPVHQAPHAAMWNADPRAYEETLRRFLTPLM